MAFHKAVYYLLFDFFIRNYVILILEELKYFNFLKYTDDIFFLLSTSTLTNFYRIAKDVINKFYSGLFEITATLQEEY